MKKIHFVTGKGGVGKSTISLALAQKLAKQHKVLLVELGHESYFEAIFNDSSWGRSSVVKVDYEPTVLEENLNLARFYGEPCLKELFKYILRYESLVNIFFDNSVMRTFMKAAPALNELAIMGKLTSAFRNFGPPMDYDRVVVDEFASGHFKAMLTAPRGMNKAIGIGPMGSQSKAMDEVLSNSSMVQYHVVCQPEELAMTEGIELGQFLSDEFSAKPEYFINKIIEPANEGCDTELKYYEKMSKKHMKWLQEISELNSNIGKITHIKEFIPSKLIAKVVEQLEAQNV